MTWAHKIQTTCKDNAILHRSFRHTEILVLSWRNIISPRSFWFHQESTHFTKSPSISPRLNLFHQDIFDFTKIFSISPRVHLFHQVRISGEGTLVKSLSENSLGEIGHLVKRKIFSWKFESNGEMKNHKVKNKFFLWMRNLNKKFHQLNTVSRSVVRTKRSYNNSIIPRISFPLSAWNNESKCLKERHHGWKSKIMTDSIRSKLQENGHYISKIRSFYSK